MKNTPVNELVFNYKDKTDLRSSIHEDLPARIHDITKFKVKLMQSELLDILLDVKVSSRASAHNSL